MHEKLQQFVLEHNNKT